MKVCIVADSSDGLNSRVADRFARAPYLVIVDLKENGEVIDVKVIENPGAKASSGAAPKVATLLSNEGVNVAVAPHFGPNASMILKQVGIKEFKVNAGVRVSDALEIVKRELLKSP